jgi:ATP-binding cassette, subfamily G (WHITE), member 2, SNQ2
MMEMKDLGDALIGDLDFGIGISVEERKRLTIGMELVAKPHILFLDGKKRAFIQFFSLA